MAEDEIELPEGDPRRYKVKSLRVGDIISSKEGKPAYRITDKGKGFGDSHKITYEPIGGGEARHRELESHQSVRGWRTAPSKRDPDTIASDRQRLHDHVHEAGGHVRVPDWASASDVDALVKEGRVERHVKVEYDKQPGTQGDKFGGAAVVQRRRAYLSPPQPKPPDVP